VTDTLTVLEDLQKLLPSLADVLAGTATQAETLAVVDQGLTLLGQVDAPLAGKVALAKKLIAAWESYGPDGPFAPAPQPMGGGDSPHPGWGRG
jgi:hypothetical protein